MLARVDRHVLVHAVFDERMFRIHFAVQLMFYERKPIRPVAIYLIRAGKNENGVGEMRPCGFEEIGCQPR